VSFKAPGDEPCQASAEGNAMPPGKHSIAIGSPLREQGPLRDTILILLPGPEVMPIALHREPLDGTVIDTVLKYGHGGLNIDGCRVSTDESTLRPNSGQGTVKEQWRMSVRPHVSGSTSGRWPPNLLLVHGPECRQVGTTEVAAPVINRFSDGMKPFGDGAGHPYEQSGGGTESVPVWECQDDCPVRLLDEQSGVTQSAVRTGGDGAAYDPSQENWRFRRVNGGFTDTGGASRFFPQFASLDDAMAWLRKLIQPV